MEYNIPRPDWVDTLQPPSGAEVDIATPKIQEEISNYKGKKIRIKSLDAWVKGSPLVGFDVPMDDLGNR
jgi:hypothetical protein